MSIDRTFWTVCISCAAIANVLAFWIFARMAKLGLERHVWSVWSDVRLYRLYWQKAPENGWSRAPLVTMGVLIAVAVSVFVLAAFLNWGK
jgi:hypothetical protein